MSDEIDDLTWEEVYDGRVSGQYDWRFKVGVLWDIRESVTIRGRALGKIVRFADYGMSRSTIYRWLREFGIRHWRTGELNWDELNAFLKPSAQRWTSSQAVHGSALLYTY